MDYGQASGLYGTSSASYLSRTKIVLNRQSDLILDNAQITAPVGIVIEDIAGLVSTVTSINTNIAVVETSLEDKLIDNDNSIAANLSTELVDRAAAVSTEASLIPGIHHISISSRGA